MFGLGVPELIFILVLALLIFGPKRLPEIGRTLGRGLSEFRRASNELKRSIEAELEEVEPLRPGSRPPPTSAASNAPTARAGEPGPAESSVPPPSVEPR